MLAELHTLVASAPRACGAAFLDESGDVQTASNIAPLELAELFEKAAAKLRKDHDPEHTELG
jgi:hypothetical protein